ncbi:MAG: GNAT family N-acetyltransferase [Sporichthyaceae bacterium]
MHDLDDRRSASGAAVVVFAQSFYDDPVFERLFPVDRAAALTEWFAPVVEVLGRCAKGRVRVVGPAAAAWTVGFCGPCLERLDDELTAIVGSLAGAAGLDLVARVQAAAVPLDVPAWFLHWLGVVPGRQGHGHGGRLLAEIVTAARGSGAALSTTTSNPGAVPFYGRHGLAAYGVRDVAGCAGLRYWTLLAPAGA